MNLLDLMTTGEDLREKALDRLDGIIALYASDDEDVQDEALARAITLCGKEWGGYKPGLEELAKRKEDADALVDALRLREEADDPGSMIRTARTRRALAGKLDGERAAIVARYGSLDAATQPSPIECMFVDVAAHLAGHEDDSDPWSPLAGWSVPWHDIPPELAAAVTHACPLPTNVADARAEALTWDERKRERDVLTDGPGAAALPTACAARHRLVADLWARGLPVRDAAELEARLEYWTSRGGDDGAGYTVLAADLRRLSGGFVTVGEGTKDKARRLKAENPDWSLARIGKELGITRQAVHKHLRR
ncbi:MAG: hypothetical protein H7Z12_18155 [Rhodospirillaceae bacterium]|nr:hypothetical protein [Rhodospirillales bacterium]